MKTMIRILIVLSAILLSYTAKAQYTQIPDPNFEQALIDLGYDDVLDGRVLTANVANVTTLNVAGKGIHDLQGLESFVSIKNLYVSDNSIESINTSNMPELRYLEASTNLISTLDLSQNAKLSKLLISGNKLTNINLNNNPQLELLWISSNQLSEIDLSNNQLLKNLVLGNNPIIDVDISNNAMLEVLFLSECELSQIDLSSNIQLKTLAIGYNQLTNINLSNNLAIESLIIQSNPIASIDLSNNDKIKVLGFNHTPITTFDFSLLPDLEHLNFNNSSITHVDLSLNQHLQQVYGAATPLETLNLKNGMNHLITNFYFPSIPSLTCIQVDDAAYSTANWTNIDPHMYFSEDCSGGGAYTLIPDPNFEQALIDVGLDDVLDGQVLTASIDTVTRLDVHERNIASLEGIQDFTSLKSLGAGRNNLTGINVSNNLNLEVLSLMFSQLSSIDVSNNLNLEILNVGHNQLSSIDVSQNIAIKQLYVGFNPLGQIDVSKNVLLERFSVQNNHLSVLDVTHNPALIDLFCSKNQLTNINVTQNPELDFLLCDTNQLTSLDVSQNTKLTRLGVYGNNLTSLDLSHNHTLQALWCKDNSLTHLNLSNMSSFRTLDASNNQLTSLNIQNGNNAQTHHFDVRNNPNLSCIQVDDAAWSTANWTQIDPQAYFSEFCGGSVDDTDGDGVPDYADDYPNDPGRAFDNYFPATGFGSLAFEDLWPGKGDYDFNDLVVDYRFRTVTNASNRVVEALCTFVVKASGASLQNGFGFSLPEGHNDFITDPSKLMVSGYRVTEPFIELLDNGFEQGQSKPTIIVFDDVFNVLPHPGGSLGINTEPHGAFVPFDTIVIAMQPTGLDYTANDFSFESWNPFMIVDRNRGIEVHLPDYPPTDLADLSVLGTYEDDSDPSAGRYYKTANNLPWVINIASTFTWPTEKVNITEAYSHFVAWAQSAGLLYNDWYLDKPGYRNDARLYEVP